ncbi:hypothetical protein PEC730217_01640 [Pectobacterium carotovorum subsp. carotovorum]|uniref:hypothetical protein n=1 Tax=Pectobacterium brasiliense TaxID=180957 RepID=UPI0004E73707|nr:hypothetical protein [Pectobacterium brasiliense]KFF72113.1 hypothetical protein IW01_05705 [Pectobacterium brasiliense]GKW31384.1 hypothetical protein PEC730217_01640 [Pectobacterium carotovorum subsp. carotovorum]
MKRLLALAAVAFIAGWYVNDLQHDSEALRITRAATAAADGVRTSLEDIAGQSGRALEQKLQELRANEHTQDRVFHTETLKPVFLNVCASDEYVRLFNDSAEQAERALSGEFVNPLSGTVPPPGG